MTTLDSILRGRSHLSIDQRTQQLAVSQMKQLDLIQRPLNIDIPKCVRRLRLRASQIIRTANASGIISNSEKHSLDMNTQDKR